MKKTIKRLVMLLTTAALFLGASMTAYAEKDVIIETGFYGGNINYNESNAPKTSAIFLDDAYFYHITFVDVKSSSKTVGNKLLYIKGKLDPYYFNGLRIFDESGDYFSGRKNPLVINKINKNNDSVISVSDNALFYYNTDIYEVSEVQRENNLLYVDVCYLINEYHVLYGYEAKLGNYIGDVFYHQYGGDTLYNSEDAYTFGHTRFYIKESDIGKSLKFYLNGQYIDTIKIK